jgi:hypothetical protein
VNAPPDYNSDQLFKSKLTFCVVCVFNLQLKNKMSGSFTIDSSTPTSTPYVKKHHLRLHAENIFLPSDFHPLLLSTDYSQNNIPIISNFVG